MITNIKDDFYLTDFSFSRSVLEANRPVAISLKEQKNGYCWGYVDGISSFRGLILPYVVDAVDIKRRIYSIKNRNYQPIYINGEGKEIFFKAPRMSEKIAKRLSDGRDYSVNSFFLYNDSCIPFLDNKKATEEYLKKLSEIAKWNGVVRMNINGVRNYYNKMIDMELVKKIKDKHK